MSQLSGLFSLEKKPLLNCCHCWWQSCLTGTLRRWQALQVGCGGHWLEYLGWGGAQRRPFCRRSKMKSPRLGFVFAGPAGWEVAAAADRSGPTLQREEDEGGLCRELWSSPWVSLFPARSNPVASAAGLASFLLRFQSPLCPHPYRRSQRSITLRIV